MIDPPKLSGQGKFVSAYNSLRELVMSMRPRGGPGTLTSQNTFGTARSARKTPFTEGLFRAKLLKIGSLVNNSTQLYCTGPTGSGHYLVETPPTFGRIPQSLDATYTDVIRMPESRQENPDGQMEFNVVLRRTHAQIRKLEFKANPNLPQSPINIDRTINQIWWPIYQPGEFILAIPTSLPSSFNVQALAGSGAYGIHLNTLTGGESALTNFYDLNIDGRRWINYRDLLSDGVVPIPPFKGVINVGGTDYDFTIPSRESVCLDNTPIGYFGTHYPDHI